MELIDYFIIFWASFFNVFLLGFQSKNVHQSRYILAWFTTWGITLAQYYFARYAAIEGGHEFLLTAGIGGSLGIICAIADHDRMSRWIDSKFGEKRHV